MTGRIPRALEEPRQAAVSLRRLAPENLMLYAEGTAWSTVHSSAQTAPLTTPMFPQRETFNCLWEGKAAWLHGLQAGLWCALPGKRPRASVRNSSRPHTSTAGHLALVLEAPLCCPLRSVESLLHPFYK